MADLSQWLPTLSDCPLPSPQLGGMELVAPFPDAFTPAPDLLASLTFFPILPDRQVWNRTWPDLGVTSAILDNSVVTPLAWAPSLPMALDRPRPPRGAPVEDAPISYHAEVAIGLTWLPRGGEIPPRPSALRDPSLPPWIAPPTLGGGAVVICAELGDDVGGAPALTTEALTATGFLRETLTTPSFLAEMIC